MNLRKQLASNKTLTESINNIGIRLGAMAAMLGVNLFVTNNFGAGAWGSYTLINIFVRIAGMLALAGLPTAFMKRISPLSRWRWPQQIILLYSVNLGWVLVNLILMSIALGFLMQQFGHRFGLSQEDFMLILMALLPYALLQFNAWAHLGLHKTNYFSFYYQNILPLLNLPIILLLSLFWYVPALPKYTLVVSTWAAALISCLSWGKQSKAFSLGAFVQGWQLPSIGTYKATLLVGRPYLVAQGSTILITYFDQLMLGHFYGDLEVGVFNVAVMISSICIFPLMAINISIAPKISKAFRKGDMETFKATTQYATALSFWLTIPIMLVVTVLPLYYLPAFGDEFIKATPLIYIMAAGFFVNAAAGPVGNIMQMSRHQVLNGNMTLIILTANVALNLMLIPRFGMMGAASASLASNVAYNLILLGFTKHYFGFFTFSQQIFTFPKTFITKSKP